MTGYARSEGSAGGSRVTVEAKSVNHRYLEIKPHLPREILPFEQWIVELGREHLNRGRVEVWVNLGAGDRAVEVSWNRPLAEGIVAALKQMQTELGLAGGVDLSLLASQKDVILFSDLGPWGDESKEELRPLFIECFEKLKAMRAREGEALARDLKKRAAEVGAMVAGLPEQVSAVVKSYRDRLAKRAEELLNGREPDEERLSQEVALFADRCDVTEEIVRFQSHLSQFGEVLGGEGPKGRKLDFLVQEMFREINTASNKAQDAEVSRAAVEVKTELEKIREQVQNLE